MSRHNSVQWGFEEHCLSFCDRLYFPEMKLMAYYVMLIVLTVGLARTLTMGKE